MYKLYIIYFSFPNKYYIFILKLYHNIRKITEYYLANLFRQDFEDLHYLFIILLNFYY